jgi:cytokinin dehydrogenase
LSLDDCGGPDRSRQAARCAGEGWSFVLSAIAQFTPPDTPKDATPTSGLRSVAGSVVTRDLEYMQYVDAIEDMPFVEAPADLGLLLPGSEAAAFLSDTLPRLREDDLGMVARIRVFVWKREPFTGPLFRAPEQDTFVYIAMLRAETTDSNTVSRLLAGNRTLFESARERGGTLYPYSALELSRDDWRRHYGERWGGLVDAKRRFDPDNVFASGPDLFR